MQNQIFMKQLNWDIEAKLIITFAEVELDPTFNLEEVALGSNVALKNSDYSVRCLPCSIVTKISRNTILNTYTESVCSEIHIRNTSQAVELVEGNYGYGVSCVFSGDSTASGVVHSFTFFVTDNDASELKDVNDLTVAACFSTDADFNEFAISIT